MGGAGAAGLQFVGVVLLVGLAAGTWLVRRREVKLPAAVA